ncbi:MAG: hypothetical protein HY854_19285 [Burkholderiales bacterium]|nr:hypothetical protein [Burkholderiales bacterium]
MFATEEPVIAIQADDDAKAARRRSMANAARQTVLRRVAPALRHDMVVGLQAVAMMAEMLNARIERGSVNPTDLQSSVSKLNRLARDAVAGCLKVTSWIDAGDEESVALQQGVTECVTLLAASFNFRGFALLNEVEPTGFEVCRNAVRSLLAASLVMLADSAPAACEIVVTGEVRGSDAVLRLTMRPRQQQPDASMPPATDATPRPLLDWDELQALADAEDATLERAADGLALTLPRALITSPLQMAPV